MENDYNFIIVSDSEEYENNYIMKCRCSCGGKYRIVSKEKIPENDIIYNVVKTICVKCNKPGEFLFDITERVRKRLGKKLLKVQHTVKDFKGTADKPQSLSSSMSLLSGVAKEIEDAFFSINALPEGPVNFKDITKSILGDLKPSPDPPKKPEEDEMTQKYNNIKFLYDQAVMKIKYMEEENKLLQIMEEKLSRKEKEIRKLQNNIAELIMEVEKKANECNELQQKLLDKDDDIEAYTRMIEEKRKPRWRKLLGGK